MVIVIPHVYIHRIEKINYIHACTYQTSEHSSTTVTIVTKSGSIERFAQIRFTIKTYQESIGKFIVKMQINTNLAYFKHFKLLLHNIKSRK